MNAFLTPIPPGPIWRPELVHIQALRTLPKEKSVEVLNIKLGSWVINSSLSCVPRKNILTAQSNCGIMLPDNTQTIRCSGSFYENIG